MIRFNDDGTAEVGYQHETIRLAEPTLSQQAEFYDLLYKVQGELSENAALRDQLEAMRTWEGDPKTSTETTDDETLEKIREQAVELNRESGRIAATLISHVVKTLGDDQEVAGKFAADPPVWAGRLDHFTRLIYHFNAVPFDGPGNPGG